MKKTKFKEIYVPIFNDQWYVYVFLGDKKRTIQEVSKITESDDWGEISGVYGKCFQREGYVTSFWVDNTLPKEIIPGVIAHEALHACMFYFRILNLDLGEKGVEEMLAHSVEAIVRKVLKEIK